MYLDQAVLIFLQVFLSKASEEWGESNGTRACSVLLDRSEIDRYNAGARLEGKASSSKAKSKKSKQVVVYISEEEEEEEDDGLDDMRYDLIDFIFHTVKDVMLESIFFC